MGPERRGRVVLVAVAVVAILGLSLLAAGAWLAFRGSDPQITVEPIQVTQPAPAQVQPATIPQAPAAPVDAASAFVGRPTELIAPAIGLDAKVLPIRVVNGTLTPPASSKQVGWDEGTSLTGASAGTSVMTGHTIREDGGAMAKLGTLQVGDSVSVRTSAGVVAYVVRDVHSVAKTAIGEEMPALYAGDGPNLLVLITCSNWTGSKHTDNTVVVAERVA